MYWYKHKNILIIALLSFTACRPQVKDNNGKMKYFDLKKYFNTEAARLNKQHPRVLKTVSHNGQAETKTVTIKHWQQEFDTFIQSDINKPAWKNSYVISSSDTGVVYTTVDSSLHTQQISLGLKNNKVTSVSIINATSNLLYNTKEKLTYYPDSIYSIEKYQDVRFLGSNIYKITGKLKP